MGRKRKKQRGPEVEAKRPNLVDAVVELPPAKPPVAPQPSAAPEPQIAEPEKLEPMPLIREPAALTPGPLRAPCTHGHGRGEFEQPAADDDDRLLPPALELWLKEHTAELGICLALVVATLAVFGRTAGYEEFIAYDDNTYVYENRHVKEGLTLDGIVWAFTHIHSSNWHPLTWLSHMLDWQLYGSRAGGHHLTNVLCHAAASVVLFLALKCLTGAVWRSGMVAGLFCLHPLHVESVAWVSERKDLLSGICFGLTLWAYAAYARRPFSWPRYALVVLPLATGLLCKPMLVSVPFVLLLLDYWPLGRGKGDEGLGMRDEGLVADPSSNESSRIPHPDPPSPPAPLPRTGEGRETSPISNPSLIPHPSTLIHLLLEKLPLLALAAASCVVTYWAQASTGAVSNSVSWGMRVQTALIAYGAYLWKMVWPFGLATPYPRMREPDVLSAAVCGLVLAAITVAVVVLARRGFRYLAVGWFWYLGMLVPVIGLITIGDQAMADRYTYLPLIGIFLALVWGGAELLGCEGQSSVGNALRGVPETRNATEGVPYRSAGIVATVAAVILSLCAIRTFDQLGYWHDSITMLRHTILVTGPNALAHTNLGAALRYAGRPAEEQAAEYREALQIQPDYYLAHSNLGFVLSHSGGLSVTRGALAEAIEHYHAGLESKSDDPLALENLGIALATLGQKAEAETRFREALRFDPESAAAESSLGQILFERGAGEEALEHLRRATAWEPDNADYHTTLGKVLAGQGQVTEGIQECQTAVNLKPDDVPARLALAEAFSLSGNVRAAVEQWKEVLKRSPTNAAANKGLGIALLRSGRPADAAIFLRRELAADPTDEDTRKALAFIAKAQGRIRETIQEFQELLRVNPNELVALNSLAWLMATCPDAAIRNGPEAVKLIQKAVNEPTKGKDPTLLDTLAAAYAEVGKFKEAVATAEKAQAEATKAGNKELAGQVETRLKLYRAGKPFRDSKP